MPPRTRTTPSRLLVWLSVLGLTLVAMVLAMLWWAGRMQTLTTPLPAGPRSDPRRLAAVAQVLLWSLLILLAFVVGALLMIRVGRIFHRPTPQKRTRYVDAWSLHRLSDEQIAELTSGDDPDHTEA